jgi:hypothetical protein
LSLGQLAVPGGARRFSGRRQPSCGGTSRMMREYQVRICERLGMKFPGPTRQTLASSLGAARLLPPSADIGPGGQSVGQAAQFCLGRLARQVFRIKPVGEKPESAGLAHSPWAQVRSFDTRSGFSTLALRQCLPDIGLRNSKLPCDCGGLDACLEGGTHRI